MPSRTLDAEIDRLYQLPLDEFTAARNALAKQAGGEAGRVRALTKPSVPAWIVNQLYWRDRKIWDALVAAAENARKVNRAVLGGKSGDVRAANAVHDEAVDVAFKAALALVATSGHPATDATRQAIATTLRALPADEPPGRLTTPIQPIGFGALAGVTVAASPKKPEPAKKTAHAPQGSAARDSAAAAREHTLQKQAEATAARELKDAETTARREEFEKARLERDARRAEATLEKAREAVERAKAELDRAERDAREAAEASRTAAERARKAQEALARVKKR
jgi:hypothetical protein